MNKFYNLKVNIMKKFIFVLMAIFPFLVSAQAHLGASISEIKSYHPDQTWEVSYTTDGIKYISTAMSLGIFGYYIDNSTGLSYFCVQIPNNMVALNAQVEIYNKKYVITSKTTWSAYLEGGGIMNISLKYNDESKMYMFYYVSAD